MSDMIKTLTCFLDFHVWRLKNLCRMVSALSQQKLLQNNIKWEASIMAIHVGSESEICSLSQTRGTPKGQSTSCQLMFSWQMSSTANYSMKTSACQCLLSLAMEFLTGTKSSVYFMNWNADTLKCSELHSCFFGSDIFSRKNQENRIRVRLGLSQNKRMKIWDSIRGHSMIRPAKYSTSGQFSHCLHVCMPSLEQDCRLLLI